MKIQSLILSIILLSSCGGGGGGGGSGNASGPQTGVRFLHTAIGTSPLSISIDGAETGSTATKFGEASTVNNIGTGAAHSVSIYRKGIPTDSVYNGAITISNNEVATILLYGSAGTKSALVSKAYPVISNNEFLIRLVNGDEGESGLAINAGNKTASATLGTSSSWLSIPAGTNNTFTVTENGGGAVFSGVVEGAGGHRYTVVVGGKGGYWLQNFVVEE